MLVGVGTGIAQGATVEVDVVGGRVVDVITLKYLNVQVPGDNYNTSKFTSGGCR